MWKGSTTRRVLAPALTSRRWRIWSGASLLAALLAALLGFQSASPALAGAAKGASLLFALGCAVFFAADRASRNRIR